MEKHFDEELMLNKRTLSRRNKMLMFLSCVVVFIVTYVLILPALTLDKASVDSLSENALSSSGNALLPPAHVFLPEEPDTEPADSENAFLSPMSMLSVSSAQEDGANTADIESSISEVILAYKSRDDQGQLSDAWTVVDDHTVFKGNERLQIKISYQNFSTQNIRDNNYSASYTVPDVLRNTDTSGIIVQGSETVGQINVSAGVATLTFERSWLDKQGEAISGDFYLEGDINLKNLNPEDGFKLVIGGQEITVNMEEDYLAKSANVDIEKSLDTNSLGNKVIHTEDGDFIEYKIIVTAGEDGCPGVYIKDAFTTGAAYISEFYGVAETAVSVTGTDGKVTEEVTVGGVPQTEYTPGTVKVETVGTSPVLVWDVGDMKPDEVRTLYIKVKMKDNYAGGTNSGRNLQNTATVYTKSQSGGEDFNRGESVANFNASAGATLSKVHATSVATADGGIRIPYTIWVSAFNTNSWPLKNFKINDTLIREGRRHTDEDLLDYLSVDPDSVKLYSGGSNLQNGAPQGAEVITPGGTLEITKDTANNNFGFSYVIDSFAPGENYTLTFDLIVSPGIFAHMGNNDRDIINSALIYNRDGNQLNAYNDTFTVSHYNWTEKSVGEKTDSAQTFQIPQTDSVYSLSGDSPSEIENPPESFVVPAGSYGYTVKINKGGSWNVSAAEFRDQLSDVNHMQCVGYMKIESFASDDANQSSAQKTAWVDINEKTDFNFTLDAIGFTGGNSSYKLTYYTQPCNTDDISQIHVRNDFTLSGTVYGPGGQQYIIDGIVVNASTVVEGGNTFAAEKSSWYYDSADTSGCPRGAFNWLIKVDGKNIPLRTVFRDQVTTTDTNVLMFSGNNNLSVRGVYIGAMKKDISEYESFDDMLADNQDFTSLTLDDDYSVSLTNDERIDLTLLRDVHIPEGNNMYIVMRSYPKILPNSKRDVRVYGNALYTSSDGVVFTEENSDRQVLYGSDNILKEFAILFERSQNADGTFIDKIIRNADSTGLQRVYRDNLDSGTYIGWTVKPNYMANLDGDYLITDNIPEGLEPVYIRFKWHGGSYGNQEAALSQINSDNEYYQYVDGWTEESMLFGTDNGVNVTSYYYINPEKTKISAMITGLKRGNGNINDPGNRDNYSCDIQVLCKVTDQDYVLGVSDRTFTNEVIIQQGGEQIGRDTDTQTITTSNKLTKEGTRIENSGNIYPFKITVNPGSEDLIKGADTYVLVDKMGSSLLFDASSLKVADQNGNPVDFTATFNSETNEISLTVPDGKKLIITYSAIVQAPPNTPISISNTVSWYGYEPTPGSDVTDGDFSYSAGGSVLPTATPEIKVTKLSASDINQKLEGAQFSLTQVQYNEESGTFTEVADGIHWSAVTDGNGELLFKEEGGANLEYDTIYKLVETSAPSGFVLDDTPRYLVVSQPTKDGLNMIYTEYPDGVQVQYSDISGVVFNVEIFNSKGKIAVTKTFENQNNGSTSLIEGTYNFGVYEQAQTAESTDAPLQTVAVQLQSGNGESASVEFKNLDLNKPYFIYELDENSKPILNGEKAVLNHIPFTVSYTDCQSVTIDGGGVANVQIKNTAVPTYDLPQTGGIGTIAYTTAGLFLCLGALFVYKKIRKKGGSA